jgi:pimeloyl-ACP methyl ester carboxylesterase
MANFLLIHGAMHGGWCWERVVPLLARHGHTVAAPDLPGMGADSEGATGVTLESWGRFVADLLAQQQGKSILVGHSLGGMVISQAAEYAPARIATLVYLTALLPRSGLSALDLTRGEDVPDMGARMEIRPTADGVCITAAPADVRAYLYGETPLEWAERAVSRLVPQPLAPLQNTAALTETNFGSVPRVYIECLRDRILPVPLQRAMHAASPCAAVVAIDTDHSPFYGAAEALAAHLLQIATRFDRDS